MLSLPTLPPIDAGNKPKSLADVAAVASERAAAKDRGASVEQRKREAVSALRADADGCTASARRGGGPRAPTHLRPPRPPGSKAPGPVAWKEKESQVAVWLANVQPRRP